jgi:hypothetical protein
MLLGCNQELQLLCKSLSAIDLSHVTDLRIHYELDTLSNETEVKKMTDKMSSLPFLKDSAPMTKVEGGYIPDLKSRYFLEDFRYGLFILRDFCGICNIKTPSMDEVLKWYEALFGLKYYEENNFTGKDLTDLPIPSQCGLQTKEDIYNFYSVY